MSQRQQLVRIMEIDRQVRAGRYPSADSLARELGVSRRVIYKDRAYMIDQLGAPLATDRERGGWYYTEPTYALPSVMATQGELLAFFLSVELAQRYVGTDFQQPLHSAVQKLSQTLKGDITIDLETLRLHYTFVPPPLMETNAQTLLAIHRAIREQRLLFISYFANTTGQRTDRTVEPYHLSNTKGDWYLLAYDVNKAAKRTFHVGRIQACRVLPDKFVRRSSISIPDWLKSSFGAEGGDEPVEVIIRFDKYQAPWIRERKWHDTAKLEQHDDGSVTLRLWTSGLGEVKRWVMQYGSHAEVLAPESLRRTVAEEVRKLLAVYAVK
ncbi:MAG: WYL domain-containing transcriptional regulator [Anaerolineae bacterium]|nr:transcriptional regulator [Candidatus Roseilinea sp.]MDW8448971.1 WYL domain-containing transcriptional regulator [Anaerolineae bacterium]